MVRKSAEKINILPDIGIRLNWRLLVVALCGMTVGFFLIFQLPSSNKYVGSYVQVISIMYHVTMYDNTSTAELDKADKEYISYGFFLSPFLLCWLVG